MKTEKEYYSEHPASRLYLKRREEMVKPKYTVKVSLNDPKRGKELEKALKELGKLPYVGFFCQVCKGSHPLSNFDINTMTCKDCKDKL